MSVTEVAALLPLNQLTIAKSRLAQVLPPHERRALALWMANRTASAIRASGVVTRLAVVSPDPAALDWARSHGAEPLLQTAGDLNAGLERGRAWALANNAAALLIVLADLPLVTPDEIARLVTLALTQPATPTVALAPDRHEQGTNAMVQRPPTAMPFAFGAASLARHLALARAQNITPVLLRTRGLGFDVDTPDDLRDIGYLDDTTPVAIGAPDRQRPTDHTSSEE